MSQLWLCPLVSGPRVEVVLSVGAGVGGCAPREAMMGPWVERLLVEQTTCWCVRKKRSTRVEWCEGRSHVGELADTEAV